jgi:hypothetical protein
MSALLGSPMPSLTALGLALALLAALAAKLIFNRVRKPSSRCEDEDRPPVAMDERIRARVEATIWPD